jgi:hypothetical protein
MTKERERLQEGFAPLDAPWKKPLVPWRRWGPYVSERAWGTVREDYSADGAAWDYFPHDMARSKAYRWGEDGLAAIQHSKISGRPALARSPALLRIFSRRHGAGLGASHQTGWTGLVASLIDEWR